MTEENKKDRTPEEMWADWARQELTDQAAELKDLRRFKRETEKELRRFKKYSAALEEEIKSLRSTVNELKFLLELSKTPDAKEQEKIQKLYEEAMKGGEKC